jgi:hypothetical protein
MNVSAVDRSASAWYARVLASLSEPRPAPKPESSGGDQRLDPASVSGEAPLSLETVRSHRAQSNLAQLAASLGTDPSTLLAKLTSGEDVRPLLSGTADAGYGTSIAKSTTGGVAIDEYA